MDDEEDKENTTHVTNDDAEISGKLEFRDNSTTDHAVVVNPEQLIGPQVIDMIMNKPEFSFLIRYYNLLYQSLIPNCKLTLHTLCQDISISDNIEQYIVGAASHRTRCQRLVNFLLIHLYSKKDYMQFCYHFNIISVLTDLPYRLIAEFRSNGYWECNIPVHPRLSLHKSHPKYCHVNKHDLHTTNNVDVDTEAENLTALSSVFHLDYSLVDNSTLHCCFVHDGASDDRADKCSISSYYHHRRRHLTLHSTTTDKQSIQRRFSELVELLPTNCYSTVCKLRKITNFTDVDEKMSDILSECDDARVINNQLLSYIINKCAGNVVLLCDVLKNVVSADKIKQLQDLAPFLQPCLRTIDVAQSSLQCSVSLAGPVVNIVHEENEQSTSFVSSSSTISVSTSKDHHVHTCPTSISIDMSLNITEPNYSTTIKSNDMCHSNNSTAISSDIQQSVLPNMNNVTSVSSKTNPSIQDKDGDTDKSIAVKLSSMKDPTTSSDKLLITTSVDVLCSQNILTYDDAVDICLADNQTKIKLLDDKLSTVSPKLTSNITATNVVDKIFPLECELPQSIKFSTDFHLLKLKYKEILECFPKNFHQSLQKLQDKLSDDQICTILNSSTPDIANKMILDCLIDRMKCREDLLDLCDQLDRLTDISPGVKCLINEIRQDACQDLQAIPSLKTKNKEENQSNNDNFSMTTISLPEQWILKNIKNERCKDVIRKHYRKLCQSIPLNHENSISKLLELKILPDGALDFVYSSKNKSKAIIDILIFAFSDQDLLLLCDIMDVLIESSALVEELRHGCLTVMEEVATSQASNTIIPHHPVTSSQHQPTHYEGLVQKVARD